MLKKLTIIAIVVLLNIITFAQSPITSVTTSPVIGGTSTTYSNGGNIYNWAVSPNNTQQTLTGFSTPTGNYSYTNSLKGVVKLKRSTGGTITGDFTLVWSEASITASPFNMQAPIPANMETYFIDHFYNKGTDNLFDNTSSNSNNIERLDWIITAGYSTPNVSKIGFAVFERGADNAHDPFVIAAITGLDVSGNPNSYGPVVRVKTTDYGNIANSTVSYRILKGASGTNLLDASTNTQNRGGVFFSLSSLGISAGNKVFGYSLLAADFPATATSADIVNTSNTTNFPINTGDAGGIDLIATTGISNDVTILPITLQSFTAKKENYNKLSWIVSDFNNEIDHFTVLKSNNALDFFEIANVQSDNTTDHYDYTDYNSANDFSTCYYKLLIKQKGGQSNFSSIVKVNSNNKGDLIIYPNPVVSEAIIKFSSLKEENLSVMIYNIAGEKISEQEIKVEKGINILHPNKIKDLNTGAYVVKLVSNNQVTQSISFLKK